MSVHHSIEKLGEVSLIRLEPGLTMDQLFAVMDAVAERDDCEHRLWDLTGAFDFSVEEVRTIAARGRVLWPNPSRVAYLATDGLAYGLLRMLEVYRSEAGYETGVFRDQDEALAWMTAQDAPPKARDEA